MGQEGVIQSATEFPCLTKVLRNFTRIDFDLTSAWRHLHWIDFGGDNREMVRGTWKTAPVYTGDHTAKGRKRNQRPDLNRSETRAALEAMKKLPELLPEITLIMRNIPEINFAGVSVLGPKSCILPHRHEGQNMICHILLSAVSSMAGLRVGCHSRVWDSAGESMVFDSSIEHEAWNSDHLHDRSILHIDFTPLTES